MTADIHTLAGPYALYALPGDESRLFEEHLKLCEACSNEVAELQATASRLGMAESTETSPLMKDAVMATIAETRQVRVVTPLRRPSLSWRQFLAPAAAALAAVVVALGFAVAQLNERVSVVEATAEQTRQVLAAGDVQLVTLAAPAGVSASFYYSEDLGVGIFVADGLHEVERSHVYELWTIHTDVAAPAGTFLPGSGGGTSLLVSGDLGTVTALGVTVEPQGGSPQPTGEVIISGEI